MTFAWYARLKTLHSTRWYVAVVASWLLAFIEYFFQVPCKSHRIHAPNALPAENHSGS
jgi:uncharacterized protein (DUF486 family)